MPLEGRAGARGAYVASRRLLLEVAWSCGPGAVVLEGVLLLAAAVLPTAFILATGAAVSAAVAAVGHHGHGAASHLYWSLGVLGLLYTVQQSVLPLNDVLADQVGLRVRGRVFERTLVALDRPSTVAHLEEPELKDLVSRATNPGQYGPRSAFRGLVNQWVIRVGGLGALGLVFVWRWWAGLALTAAMWNLLRRTRSEVLGVIMAQAAQTQVLRRSDYIRLLMLGPIAAKEVRVFGLGDWLVGRFRQEWLGAMTQVWARRRGIWAAGALGVVPLAVVVGVIAAVAVGEALHGVVGTGRLVVVVQSLLAAPAAASVTPWDNWLELGLSSLDAMADLEAAVAAPRLSLPGCRVLERPPTAVIAFEEVSFSYPGQSRPIFDRLDLSIPVGTSLAVVGDNGAGKTTLVKLLARLYDPAGGRITVDGVDLRELDPRWWQQQVAVIFQDFLRYPLSLRDNVSPDADLDPEVLARVASQAGALDLVEGLAEGWDTILGREFGGTDLSGGQWQRVALARALAAAEGGAPLLVMDEPTAQLDVRQEAAFYERFLDITSQRTSLVISHRFSTVRRADRIVVLSGGRITEAGTHDELVEAGGRYAELFGLQASRFLLAGAEEPQ
ncbi:MAG TPA: ABC transporter ATP-binding protein/permease [Acidimicrobiales bacterium]|nr:ABC transporter ATP-binding protein/permease [Acidimicrobiales bacterium]